MAASRACRRSRSRLVRAGRVCVCRGICGSSPHGSSLWEAAGDEAHLHTDSLPQPRQAPQSLTAEFVPAVFPLQTGVAVADLVRCFQRNSQIIQTVSPERHFFSTIARAQPSWEGPRMHCWGGEAVTDVTGALPVAKI